MSSVFWGLLIVDAAAGRDLRKCCYKVKSYVKTGFGIDGVEIISFVDCYWSCVYYNLVEDSAVFLAFFFPSALIYLFEDGLSVVTF